MLSASSISFSYPSSDTRILDAFSLEVEPGEFAALRAPSGRGKTTLAKILAGYETPSSGIVRADGEDIRRIKGFNPVQLVFQHPEKAVNPRWKMKRTLAESGTIDEEAFEALDIEQEWLERYPNELSGGELQRFCVARVLSAKTRYLIADEMTTMLDPITQAKIWRAVRSWAEKNNAGVLVISHDSLLVSRLCDRIIDLAAASPNRSQDKD